MPCNRSTSARNLQRRVLRRKLGVGGLGLPPAPAQRLQALDRQHLLAEDQPELPRRLVRNGFQARAVSPALGTSRSRLVTAWSAMPQGMISSKSRRSVVTLKAKPCEVMPRET